jgi:hypothetical protein
MLRNAFGDCTVKGCCQIKLSIRLLPFSMGGMIFIILTRQVPQEYLRLETRAEECINCLHKIESEIFAHSFSDGKLVPKKPEYWPYDRPGLVRVDLRQLW